MDWRLDRGAESQSFPSMLQNWLDVEKVVVAHPRKSVQYHGGGSEKVKINACVMMIRCQDGAQRRERDLRLVYQRKIDSCENEGKLR